MAQLTAQQLKDKLHFAGVAIPSMKRRCEGHDYEARQMYLITITVEGRRPLLGRVIGNPEVEKGAPNEPRIELSSLGKEVEQEWMAISQYHPEVKVLALQIMPDHLHSILYVKERMPQHLGHIIKGFKASTNKAYRRLIAPHEVSLPIGRDASSRPVCCDAVATNSIIPPQRPRPDRKHGLLWSIGYTDGILGRQGQLDNWFAYLRDNPRRLLMKRLHPEFFRVQRNVKVGGYEFSAIGNRYLLTHPVRLQVQCSRRLTNAEIAQQQAYYLEQAKRGAVLVSPSISPGEKAIMRAAFDAGCPLILLQENGFTDLAKPGGVRFDACAEGRLLILAPWEHHNQRLAIQRNQCLSLNEMARVICE